MRGIIRGFQLTTHSPFPARTSREKQPRQDGYNAERFSSEFKFYIPFSILSKALVCDQVMKHNFVFKKAMSDFCKPYLSETLNSVHRIVGSSRIPLRGVVCLVLSLIIFPTESDQSDRWLRPTLSPYKTNSADWLIQLGCVESTYFHDVPLLAQRSNSLCSQLENQLCDYEYLDHRMQRNSYDRL